MQPANLPPTFTADELRQAIGGLLMVLGSAVPPEAARFFASQLTDFARHCDQNLQANVGTLARGFAQALEQAANAPTADTN